MVLKEQSKIVEVICQHTKEAKIIPLKIRLEDEDGEIQTYMVRGYRDLTHYGSYRMPNEIVAAKNSIWSFECLISVFGTEKRIKLMYNGKENLWKIL